ncbi:exodeoxyribonuclease III, partial [Lactobacillus gasseri]|nr:exodeoxyribonuclease III [Lactobacillus gasseri]
MRELTSELIERRIIMKFMSWNVNGLRAALRHGFVNT